RKLYELVVEKGHPQLKTVCHGHLVGFQEQIVGKPDLGVRIQHSIQGILLGNCFKTRAERGVYRGPSAVPSEKLTAQFGRHSHRYSAVSLVHRERGPTRITLANLAVEQGSK